MRVYSVSSGGASPSGLPRRRSQRIERPKVSVWAFGYTHYLTERREFHENAQASRHETAVPGSGAHRQEVDHAGAELESRFAAFRDSARRPCSESGTGVNRHNMKNRKKNISGMGALPPNPRDLSLSRQDSWTERRAALATSESRPLSRRSGCVSAEPYPPLRSVQSTRDALQKSGRLHKKLDAPSSGGQFEELVDELNLTPNIRFAHPPNLPLPQHVHRLIPLNRSLRRLEFSEPLLGVYATFDRAVILLQDIVQVLYGSVPATAAKYPFLLYVGDGRAVDRCQIRIDDTRLRMGRMAQRLPK